MDHLGTAALVLMAATLAIWAAAVLLADNRRRRRLDALARVAGLRLSSARPVDPAELSVALRLFTRGHSRFARVMLDGRVDGLPVRLIEYRYETGTGVHRRTHLWQVVLVQSEYHCPALLVEPREQHDPLETVFALDEVAFQAEPFASRFRVASEDQQLAYQLLHPRLTDLLMAEPKASLEIRGQTVAVCRPGSIGPEQALALVRLACRVPALFPPQLGQELRVEGHGPGQQS